jgi:thioredoxin 1
MIDLTKDNFDLEVVDESTPVLVDFWATWCGPCQMAGPILDELDKEYDGKIKIGKVNVDEEPGLAQKYGVMSIPTVVLFKEGKEVDRQIGFNGKDGYTDMLKKAV